MTKASSPVVIPRPHMTFRPEIQGLRAIAVLAVFAFHLWPSGWFAGGYVGVDVFFVISGFLITGLLLKEFEATGGISLTRFYSRRIRRLLPAATLVLVALALCIALFPVSQWRDIAHDIGASALYFQNWNLAGRAVDYLASGGPQSPLEHFWSLSVEEQYYFVWPLLALLSVRVTRAAARHPRAAFGVFVGVVGVGSLLYSVWITPRQPGLAYFATTTRAWELALGGALAVFRAWERWPGRLRAVLGPLGLAFIVAACTGFDTDTAFPGYRALLPTVGAAMVIVCADGGGRVGLQRLLALKPFQYLGDVSYSLYLWHWPVIVLYTRLRGTGFSWRGAAVIFAVSLLLAHVSKVYVEDRWRSPAGKDKAGRDWQPLRLATVCISLSVVAAGAVAAGLHYRVSAPGASLSVAGNMDSIRDYPGARVLTDGAPAAPASVPYQPRPALAGDDHPPQSCHQGLTGTEIVTCGYGASDSAAPTVVLLGDSHADQWLPAFRVLAKKRHWHLIAMTKSACAIAAVDPDQFTTDSNKSCAVWNRNVLARLQADPPDAVIIAQSKYSLGHIENKKPHAARPLLIRRMLVAWHDLAATGATLYVIKDTPQPSGNVPECLSAPGASIKECSADRSEALGHFDPLLQAARQMQAARLIDMDDAICGPQVCRVVVGNVLVYRDTHHLTGTFMRTLVPALSRAIEQAGGALAR